MALPQKLEDVSLESARQLRDQFLKDWPEWQELVSKMNELERIEDGNEEQSR